MHTRYANPLITIKSLKGLLRGMSSNLSGQSALPSFSVALWLSSDITIEWLCRLVELPLVYESVHFETASSDKTTLLQHVRRTYVFRQALGAFIDKWPSSPTDRDLLRAPSLLYPSALRFYDNSIYHLATAQSNNPFAQMNYEDLWTR